MVQILGAIDHIWLIRQLLLQILKSLFKLLVISDVWEKHLLGLFRRGVERINMLGGKLDILVLRLILPLSARLFNIPFMLL